LIDFADATVSADAEGKVKLRGGPANFTLSLPLDDKGTVISLTITETQIESAFTLSPLRTGGLQLDDGLLGGIIPCGILGQPLELWAESRRCRFLKTTLTSTLQRRRSRQRQLPGKS
jgi:hypothetical protein